MTTPRLAAIVFIFVCSTVAWLVLAGSVVERTGERDGRLAQEVEQLWGGRHTQVAPDVWVERDRQVVEDVTEKDAAGRAAVRQVTKKVTDRVPVPLASSRIDVDLELDQRRKGLLWYSTHAVSFHAVYVVRNPGKDDRLYLHFSFPSAQAIYDAFVLRVNGQEAPPAQDLSAGIVVPIGLPSRGEAVVEISYHSRGLGAWTYAFSASGVAQVRDFTLAMKTNFRSIDFPAGTLSPTSKSVEGAGWRLAWRFESLVTGQRIGMDPPRRLNPGPLAARITFFAPVSLLFFLTVMVILGAVHGQSLHPMNYFFLAAAFFAFHLLLAYLADHINIHVAFGVSSAVSVLLSVTYLRLVAGMRFALVRAGLAQMVFLVLFGYAFFFEGYTGLTVSVGAVLTLFVLMQITGRVDWGAVFARKTPVANAAEGPGSAVRSGS